MLDNMTTRLINQICLVVASLILLSGCGVGDKDIFTACEAGHVRAVENLLRNDPGLVHTTDSDGLTPLHHAAFGGNVNVVELLLRMGADVNATSAHGSTPLHMAVENAQP